MDYKRTIMLNGIFVKLTFTILSHMIDLSTHVWGKTFTWNLSDVTISKIWHDFTTKILYHCSLIDAAFVQAIIKVKP